METRPPPAAHDLPETAIVLAVALAAAAALAVLAITGFGATVESWLGLTAGAAAILFSGLAVLAGAPRGWRWVGATVCAHLGLHPWLAAAAAQQPAALFAVALVALTLWMAFAVLERRSLRGWKAALLLGLAVGISALLRPDLLALTLPLGTLALWLAESPRPVLLAFAATAAAAIAAGLALRWQVLGLQAVWGLEAVWGHPNAFTALAVFLQVNAVALTAGLAALALLGKRGWRPAALLFGPLLSFAGLSFWNAPRLESAQALTLPLLPLLTVAFGVLLARALDALPAIRPADDLGKTAALILGLIFVLHLLGLGDAF